MSAHELDWKIQPSRSNPPAARAPVLAGRFSISDLMREAAERCIDVHRLTDRAATIDMPSMSGTIMAEEVQPGLLMSGSDLAYIADDRIEMSVDRSIMCAVLLDGEGEPLELEGRAPFAQGVGSVAIVGFGEARRCARSWFKGQRARVFGVTIKPHFFERFGAVVGDDALETLHAFMRPGIHTATLPWSRELIDIGATTLKGPYGGSLSMLFRESQTLRFTLGVASLLREQERLIRRMGRRPYDRACEAREILDRSIVDPPKVLDLARRLGANVTTLQANFKAAFGTTIFGYVRDQRLQLARILILDHGLRIAEAGYRVGFTNASAFTAAYRRCFGRAPSADVAAR